MTYGPNLRKLGTQPLNIQPAPSLAVMVFSMFRTPSFCEALMTRLLITSTGLQMVVATKPAKKLLRKWVDVVSPIGVY